MSGLRDHRIEALTPRTIQVLWRRRPVWTIVVAILFFPWGSPRCSSFVGTRDSIVVSDGGPPATISFAGVFSADAVGAIDLTIA